MKRDTIQADLKAYRDNELPLLRRLAVRRHIAQCPACREEVATMEKITHTLQSAESTEPLSETLRSRILAGAAKAGASSSPLPSGEGRGGEGHAAPPLLGAGGAKRRLSPAVVGGICLAVALIAFFAMHRMATRTNSLPSPRYAGIQDAYVQSNNEPFPAPADSPMAGAQPAANLPPQMKGEMARSLAASGIARPMAAPASDLPADFSLNRQVHREASLTVQLKDPESASDQVEQMTKDAGGFVASNDLTTSDSGEKSAQMSLKVPVAQFDTVLGEVEKLGNVTAKNVTGQDITGKVSDAGQAESVLEDEVARSNSHLATLGRHAKWEDEEDARELRIELAQARARVVLLNKLATLADISVNLNETPKPTPPAQTGFMSNLRGNGSAAFQSMIGTLEVVLAGIIWILAYIPIWGPIAFAVWYTRRYLRETQA